MTYQITKAPKAAGTVTRLSLTMDNTILNGVNLIATAACHNVGDEKKGVMI